MTKKRFLITGLITLVIALLVVAELTARASINNRIAARADAQFAGDSALVSLATRTFPITVGLDEERLEELLEGKMARPFAQPRVIITDGYVGLQTSVAGQEATVWLTLSVVNQALSANVASIQFGDRQLSPEAFLDNTRSIDLPGLIPQDCGASLTGVTAREDVLEFTVSVTPAALGCIVVGAES